MNQVEQLIALAQNLADELPQFFLIKGAGVGDRATHSFMTTLRSRATQTFGDDFAEKHICGQNNLAVDYFFPAEATIVEIALGLRNPLSEFERDILKALMAQEAQHPVQRLVFLSKPGAAKRLRQPSSVAMIAWAKQKHNLAIEVRELDNHHVQ